MNTNLGSEKQNNEKIRVSDFIANFLHYNNFDLGFCVPGESYLSLLDSLRNLENFNIVTARHEACAGNMALAHAKLSNNPGILMVTRGPGLTHALISIHTAKQDMHPLVAFVGDVETNFYGKEAFQEIDYHQSFSAMVKKVIRLDNPNRTGEYLHQAFSLAKSGRPGPVLVILPEDVLDQEINYTKIKISEARNSISQSDVENFIEIISKAKKPILIAGGGYWDQECYQMISEFASKFICPVALSFRCKDYMDNDDDYYAGDLAFASRADLVDYIKDSDLVIALGTRLSEVESQSYSILPFENNKLVHIFPDNEELGKNYQNILSFCCSSKEFLHAVCHTNSKIADVASLRKKENFDYLHKNQHEFALSVNNIQKSGTVKNKQIDLCKIMKFIDEVKNDDTIICNGAGNYAIWVQRFLSHKKYGTLLAPKSGAMGFGFPAAIAAKIANPEKEVLCFAGDGCFMMAVSELATIASLNLPVKIIIMNNSSFGTIRMHQEKRFPKRKIATDLSNPDFVMLANSFGIDAIRIEDDESFFANFPRIFKAKNPFLIELVTDINNIAPGKYLDH